MVVRTIHESDVEGKEGRDGEVMRGDRSEDGFCGSAQHDMIQHNTAKHNTDNPPVVQTEGYSVTQQRVSLHLSQTDTCEQ